MMAHELIDGRERHRQNPDTFEIPSDATVAALRVGDHVKVGALTPGAGRVEAERFWVQLTSIRDDRTVFVGWIDNLLTFTEQHGLDYEDEVQFEARHILATLR